MSETNDPRNSKSLGTLEREMKKLRRQLEKIAEENAELAKKVDALQVTQKPPEPK